MVFTVFWRLRVQLVSFCFRFVKKLQIHAALQITSYNPQSSAKFALRQHLCDVMYLSRFFNILRGRNKPRQAQELYAAGLYWYNLFPTLHVNMRMHWKLV